MSVGTGDGETWLFSQTPWEDKARATLEGTPPEAVTSRGDNRERRKSDSSDAAGAVAMPSQCLKSPPRSP